MKHIIGLSLAFLFLVGCNRTIEIPKVEEELSEEEFEEISELENEKSRIRIKEYSYFWNDSSYHYIAFRVVGRQIQSPDNYTYTVEVLDGIETDELGVPENTVKNRYLESHSFNSQELGFLPEKEDVIMVKFKNSLDHLEDALVIYKPYGENEW